MTSDTSLYRSLFELIKKTSCSLAPDVKKRITLAKRTDSSKFVMDIVDSNIGLAEKNITPICQDTGTLTFYISHPMGFDQESFKTELKKVIIEATKEGILRENSVDSISGEVVENFGDGNPEIKYNLHEKDSVEIRLIMKGGGCENVSSQYSLPNTDLNALRDLDGVKKVILDSVENAGGKGCAPGFLGVSIGGDRATGFAEAKKQFLRASDDLNSDPDLLKLEQEIVESANLLEIGPMGLGGSPTLLSCKCSKLNRLPASFFVSISYMCWAFRRNGISLNSDMSIKEFLY